jgi:anti-sigma B factor antagonist
MADVIDPPPADRSGIDGAGGQGAGRLWVGTSTRQYAGQLVVALAGELDVADAVRIGALVTTVAIRVPRLIVDLAALEFTDCAGMRALATAAKQARQAGGGLVLAAPRSLVLRVLDLTGLMTGVPVYSSVEEAARVASPQRAARPVPVPDAQVIVAGLPPVRPGRQQEEGQRGPHHKPAVADTRP